MPFINEQPSEADIVKYGLREQDAEFGQTMRKPEWTVDHERGIYLRYMKSDAREAPPVSLVLVFYWRGYRIDLHLESDCELKGYEYGEETLRFSSFWHQHRRIWLPPDMAHRSEQVVFDLKEALIARNGIYEPNENARYAQYVLTLDF